MRSALISGFTSGSENSGTAQSPVDPHARQAPLALGASGGWALVIQQRTSLHALFPPHHGTPNASWSAQSHRERLGHLSAAQLRSLIGLLAQVREAS